MHTPITQTQRIQLSLRLHTLQHPFEGTHLQPAPRPHQPANPGRVTALRLAKPLVLRTTWLSALLIVALSSTPASAQGQLAENDVRGGLSVKLDGKSVEMPLTALAVNTELAGDIATVSVEQTYENPFGERIEAVYTFPLPEDAAVINMVMVIGERRIRADLKEKEEAKRTYEEARERGQTASLLEQQRSNIFTQSVANIEPGTPVTVLIEYVEQLPYHDAQFHYAFPMVVGPRYIPGAPTAHLGTGVLHDTDQVPDASLITPPVLPEGIPVPYKVDFDLHLVAGMAIHDVTSSSHDLVLDWKNEKEVRMTLPEDQRTPDRDVVFSYALSDNIPAVGVLSHQDERGGFFTLMVQPPAAIEEGAVRAKEMVFVLDCSGSMYGHPMDTSKALMRHAITHMNADDTFRIVRFSDQASSLSSSPMSNTPENIEKALAFIDGLEGSGGTEMTAGIRAALDPAPDGERLRIVLFLTDGYIGNDNAVLSLIASEIGQARLFSLGVGSSVNRYLLDKMAEMGRGSVHYVNVDEDATAVVEAFYSRIQNPIFTDLSIDFGDLEVSELTPSPIPDVFSQTPIVITGRYAKAGRGAVTISGLQGSTPTSMILDVQLTDSAEQPAIPFVWARRKVDALMTDAMANYDDDANKVEVLALALQFRLLTKYTSFVAVDERITANVLDPLRTKVVAVNLPDGVSEDRIGVQVSPNYVQPGDPELEVWAPPTAIAVTAYFPFGLVQNLDFDLERELWQSRFLVPRDVEDGRYSILITVEYENGTVEIREVDLDVDATAPLFEAALVSGDEVEPDATLTIHVQILEQKVPAAADTVLGGRVLPDAIKFVRLHLPDGRQVRIAPDDAGALDFRFKHRQKLGTGTFELLVEAVDVAGNSTFDRLTYTVTSPSEVAALAAP